MDEHFALAILVREWERGGHMPVAEGRWTELLSNRAMAINICEAVTALVRCGDVTVRNGFGGYPFYTPVRDHTGRKLS